MNPRGGPDGTLTRLLSDALRSRGVPAFGYLDHSRLCRVVRDVSPRVAASYGLDAARGALVAALHYDTTGAPAGSMDADCFQDREGRPLASLGWFARAHWYRELADILASASRDPGLAAAAPRKAFRVGVNSRLPEKALAAAAGLGPVGRNTLVLERTGGPGCVLGVLLLPFEPDASGEYPRGNPEAPVPGGPGSAPQDPLIPGSQCGDCYECVRACPTGAVRGDGGIDRLRCIQHWAGAEGPVPPEIADAWRGNLYGCDLCLAACPRFRPGVELGASRGVLGPGLDPEALLRAGDGELRERFRGTALGLSWLSPEMIRRNARLARDSRSRKPGIDVV